MRLHLGLLTFIASSCGGAQSSPVVDIKPLPSVTAPLPVATSLLPAQVHRHADDRDGDGVIDDLDKCPDDPEDRVGFQDEDGCPDPDNDQDGIPDVRDQCPNDPGPRPTGCPP